ncbi:hypothetical protein PV367_05860 [Streptomyces europaeiscabiei]|uniref:Uncharacterized protein n=1 Tax=Streptomyces europaeiscabiei TaxID=146819 RepID=A0AAJ2PLG1_9ACTN|nr:hypothetical protein [Streptomyces europaeiscabiei]MDX3129338.1 hypothetical protein [Streptomyces europaeiscabiei]
MAEGRRGGRAQERCWSAATPTRPSEKPPASAGGGVTRESFADIRQFAAADASLRARQVCEAMDMEIAPNDINNTRLKLKQLTERGILVETEQGLFTPPRP